MRSGLFGIVVGLSIAVGLKNERSLSSTIVSISLLSEIMTIVIFGLIDIS